MSKPSRLKTAAPYYVTVINLRPPGAIPWWFFPFATGDKDMPDNALIFPAEIQDRLLQNGRLRQQLNACKNAIFMLDFAPVVKLFIPDAGVSWLVTEIDPSDHDRAFGLYTEDGRHRHTHFSFSKIAALRSPTGARVTSDPHFIATKMLTAYASRASIVRFGRSAPGFKRICVTGPIVPAPSDPPSFPHFSLSPAPLPQGYHPSWNPDRAQPPHHVKRCKEAVALRSKTATTDGPFALFP